MKTSLPLRVDGFSPNLPDGTHAHRACGLKKSVKKGSRGKFTGTNLKTSNSRFEIECWWQGRSPVKMSHFLKGHAQLRRTIPSSGRDPGETRACCQSRLEETSSYNPNMMEAPFPMSWGQPRPLATRDSPGSPSSPSAVPRVAAAQWTASLRPTDQTVRAVCGGAGDGLLSVDLVTPPPAPW